MNEYEVGKKWIERGTVRIGSRQKFNGECDMSKAVELASSNVGTRVSQFIIKEKARNVMLFWDINIEVKGWTSNGEVIVEATVHYDKTK